MDSPSSVATRFFAAIDQGDFEGAASFLEPTGVETLRESEVASLVGWARQRDSMKASSSSGPSMHGFSVDETVDTAALEKFSAFKLSPKSGVKTLGELAAQPASAFAATYLRVTSGAFGGGPLVPPITRQVIGEIIEDDMRSYVVYRTTGSIFDDGQTERARLLTFRRVASEWRLELSSLTESPLGAHMFTMSIMRP